jgi:Spy/CpxP family protein refolding chaperone
MTTRWILAFAAFSGVALADPPKPDDPIGARLFPPELIMKHQRELAIDDKQRDALVGEVQRTQQQTVALQWQMTGATEALVKLLEAGHVDEVKALAQADQIMTIERDFKRTHLAMLIRIRNLLTDAQRERLAQLRKEPP